MSDSLVDIALLAYGGPETLADIPAFLRRMTGREPEPSLLAELEERYGRIGGGSPLPAITARQARALQASLVQQLAFPVRVRHGFLFSEPTVAQCLEGLDARVRLALPMSPFASRLTSERYRTALAAAGAGDVALLGGWHASRPFVQALSRRIAEALDGSDPGEWAVLFTAHNVPLETVLEGDPYVDQLQQTVAQLVPLVMPGDWRFGFQSRGRGGGEWLEPEVGDALRVLAGEGWKRVLVVPVGFVADNVETLYDLDVVLRQQAEDLGMEYRRVQAPNDSPQFIEALADVVIQHLAQRPVERPQGPHDHGGR